MSLSFFSFTDNSVTLGGVVFSLLCNYETWEIFVFGWRELKCHGNAIVFLYEIENHNPSYVILNFIKFGNKNWYDETKIVELYLFIKQVLNFIHLYSSYLINQR